jgi:endonuclease/exonuclease/phosphatase family metal-dependent hydrolase
MCKTILIIALYGAVGALTLGCASPAPFRVLSFNIRTASANDGPNAWDLRRDLVVETIRGQQPDVIALQEVLFSQVTELRAALPEYGFVGVGRDDGAEQGEFVPIFYRRERFSLLDSGHFWLSATPEQVGSVGWDAALPRMATWVRLRFKDALLADVRIANVHFDHRGERARAESAKLIRRYSEALGGQPLVVLGDFNCPPGSEPYRILTEKGRNLAAFVDAQGEQAPAVTGGTFHAFTGQPEGGRIDWILVNRRFKVTAWEVDRRDFDGRYPSDHFPVAATLRLLRR